MNHLKKLMYSYMFLYAYGLKVHGGSCKKTKSKVFFWVMGYIKMIHIDLYTVFVEL